MSAFHVIDAEQRSPEWFAARLGRLTGSRAGDMLATIKSGEAAARRDYRMQLVCERLTSTLQEDGFVNAAIQRGIDCEPLARDLYERRTGRFIQTTGFLASTAHMAGCSLDGHVGDYDGHPTFEGIVELKCPKSATHLRYLRSNVVPAEHLPQILHNLWITGAAWCDFVSFDDRFDPALSLWIMRVERNEQAIADYEAKALAFLAEVDIETQAIQTMRNPAAVLREAVA
jgi:hypothetical protein